MHNILTRERRDDLGEGDYLSEDAERELDADRRRLCKQGLTAGEAIAVTPAPSTEAEPWAGLGYTSPVEDERDGNGVEGVDYGADATQEGPEPDALAVE